MSGHAGPAVVSGAGAGDSLLRGVGLDVDRDYRIPAQTWDRSIAAFNRWLSAEERTR